MSTKKTPELVQKAQSLHDLGLSYNRIGKELGFNHQTIRCWLDPIAAEKSKQRSKKWYEDNLERAREKNKERHRGNPEKNRERARKWREDNLEKSRRKNRELSRKWREDNPGKNRERLRKWREDNLERAREHARKWQQANPDKAKLADAIRRAMKRNASIPLTPSEQSQLRLIYKNCPDGYHIDHIIPLSKGGLHHPLNLQYLPAEVNCSKNNNIRQQDIELFRYRLIHETSDTDTMTFVDLLESLP
jgi:hypothetical protein